MATLYTSFVEYINQSYSTLYKNFDMELNKDMEDESHKLTSL